MVGDPPTASVTDMTDSELTSAFEERGSLRVRPNSGYLPDKQEKAAQTVLGQAELLCADWGGEKQVSIKGGLQSRVRTGRIERRPNLAM